MTTALRFILLLTLSKSSFPVIYKVKDHDKPLLAPESEIVLRKGQYLLALFFDDKPNHKIELEIDNFSIKGRKVKFKYCDKEGYGNDHVKMTLLKTIKDSGKETE